jgi:glycyl-tRNA synthetase beta chain
MSPVQTEIESSKIEISAAVLEQVQPKPVHRRSPVTFPLLLEVGCEEIPARFLRDAEKGLGERVRAALKEARLLSVPGTPGTAHESAGVRPAQPVETYSTPRRLVVHVPAVLAHQPDKVEEILGPPVKVAVNAEGHYTRAAESFAQKNAAHLEDLARTTTPKGEYLSLRKTTPGRPALDVLPEILPAAILGLSFPKSMYWTEKSAARFVRPIRWVLAILGEGKNVATVKFDVVGVKSGNFTFGHRVKGSKPLVVHSFRNYSNKLIQSFVEIRTIARVKRIVEESKAKVDKSGFKLLPDEWLTDWIVNATEWPRPILGTFDERFLHLPREILITVMRDHQRYFAVEPVGLSGARPGGVIAPQPEIVAAAPTDGARLAPHFVAVLNMDSDETGLIRQGHERVLTARFRDAEFFWNADQKTPLRDRLPLLDRVTFQAELGNAASYGDKVRRMKVLGGHLCDLLETAGVRPLEPGSGDAASGVNPALPPDIHVRQNVLRAIELCKCDLTTQMVQEFTELQGVVGGLYAKAQGEPEDVAAAIYDHYLPLGAEGASPRTLTGTLVSVADKVDSVVSGFAVGHEPTGSSDPFALRRQANGVIKVILENNIPFSLKEMENFSFETLKSQWGSATPSSECGTGAESRIPSHRSRRSGEEVASQVLEFFAERLRYYFESVRGFRYDTVRAVMAAGADYPSDAQARAEAVEALRGSDDFEALSAAAKRIRNILAKSATGADWQAGEVERALLIESQERELYEAHANVAAEVARLSATRDYRRALELISTLRPAVDRFFDKVLVMAREPAVRQNRLGLLRKLDELFSGIAHFAEIAEKQ